MTATVVQLPARPGPGDDRPGGAGADHPMRRVTREALAGPEGWSDERRVAVNELFDRLAAEWHTRDGPGRHLPVLDALERGAVGRGTCLELGSGIGLVTPDLVGRFDRLVAADLAMEMLRLAPADVPRLRADGSRLPFPDGSIDVLLLMNMLLFPTEAARVTAPDGAVVWVNSRGPATPIHLPGDDVVAALPGRWAGVASRVGEATWCVARRDAGPRTGHPVR